MDSGFTDLSKAHAALVPVPVAAVDKAVVVESLRGVLAANRSRIQDLFRELDDSQDGKVSKEELGKALRMLGHEPSEDELKALFNDFDLDSNGRVDYKELHAALRARPQQPAQPPQSTGAGTLAFRRGKALQPVDTPIDEESVVVKDTKKGALKNKWRGRLGAALLAQKVLMTPLRKMRMRFSMQKATDAGKDGKSAAVTQVDTADELAKIAIWQQGDESLYTECASTDETQQCLKREPSRMNAILTAHPHVLSTPAGHSALRMQRCVGGASSDARSQGRARNRYSAEQIA